MRTAGARAALIIAASTVATAHAQQRPAIGTVPTADALINGQVQVNGGEASLISNVSVTVYDHSAPVTLGRGGQLLVCSTSEFHLLRSNPGESLVFGLDRGALELRSATQTGDMVITPDLTFTPATPGLFDLRLRVTREGDTCVENDGARAPVLNVTDAFSSDTYRIMPGQHMLFVKGDLHRVVDHESSPCGCPAGAREYAARPGQPVTAAQAHPFPEAQSQGLAPTETATNEGGVGVANSQVSTSFSYGEGATPPPGIATATGAQAATGQSSTAPVPAPEKHGGFFRAIGRFFKRLFGPADGPE